MKYKIINVTSDSNIGGAGRCILTFLEHYDREKFDIKVALPKGSALIPYIEALNTEYIELDGIAETSYSREGVSAFKKVFEAEKPNLVHTHASLSARIAAKMLFKPVIYTRHSVFPNDPKLTKGLGKLACSLLNNFTANKIIAVAGAAKDNLTETGVKEKKITVLKNGVKPIKKYSDEEISKAREFYNVKSDDFVFGLIARVEDIKGHDYYLDAAKEVIKTHPEAKFFICGTGGYFEHVKKRVEDEQLNSNVILTGYIKDVTSVMNVIDVNVNASFGTEATSLSLLEGMSVKKPIIASRYGGNPELVEDGVNGLLFETKNAEQLAEKMLYLIENKDAYNTLCEGAYKLYNEKYTAQIYARNIEDVYLQVLEGKRGKNR